jgi:septal ring factor EnvC (AmiA/AmiB activator)
VTALTVKEFAKAAGVTTAAVYKRLKVNGLDIAELKDPDTGKLTPEGIEQLQALFGGSQPELTTELTTEVDRLTTELMELSTKLKALETELSDTKAELESMKAENALLREREKLLTDERDFLRKSLDQEQQLQALTLTKVPAPPALPSPDDAAGLPWYKRLFRKGGKDS